MQNSEVEAGRRNVFYRHWGKSQGRGNWLAGERLMFPARMSNLDRRSPLVILTGSVFETSLILESPQPLGWH